jgi:hypothetical protein
MPDVTYKILQGNLPLSDLKTYFLHSENKFLKIVAIRPKQNSYQASLNFILMSQIDTIEESLLRLECLCEIVPPLLHALHEPEVSAKPSPGKWSKKEILGHLIDSATHNHHRFVRAQFEARPFIVYDQDAWNRYSYYHQLEWSRLILFWEVYNSHLLSLIRHIPEVLLSRPVQTGNQSFPDIGGVIVDYVAHMEHHLRQITDIP